jgi:hypothetical protein
MLLLFAVFAILGGPLVFVIWETINQVLTGDFGAIRLECSCSSSGASCGAGPPAPEATMVRTAREVA